jgi:molecular chaperone GrpE (heat shock protein)
VSAQPNGVRSQESKLETQNFTTLQELSDLRQEYDRLQQQLANQRQILWQEFQQSSVQILESLLLQLPTAAYAAQQNPQAPAVKMLPLLRPLDTLLEQWGIESIATVGAEIPYDPQQHQLMGGIAQTGDRVKVRYTGYRQGDRLLYRAKVSAIEPM